jgi:hypothetical protein
VGVDTNPITLVKPLAKQFEKNLFCVTVLEPTGRLSHDVN